MRGVGRYLPLALLAAPFTVLPADPRDRDSLASHPQLKGIRTAMRSSERAARAQAVMPKAVAKRERRAARRLEALRLRGSP